MTEKGIDLSQEVAGKAAKVAEGFWIVATHHYPGGSRAFPAINNRCLVMRVEEAGTPVLVVFKVADKGAVAGYWNQILQWPAKTVMTYHDPPGFAFQGDGQVALRNAAQAAGQLN